MKRLLTEEPVRVYLYTVAVTVVALLVALGYMTAELGPLALAVVAAVLAVPGVEAARSKVTPVAKLDGLMQQLVDGAPLESVVEYGDSEGCEGCPEAECEDCAYQVGPPSP